MTIKEICELGNRCGTWKKHPTKKEILRFAKIYKRIEASNEKVFKKNKKSVVRYINIR
ncbi:MAG: hypothetical protein ACRCZ0_08415 [Cetobacterium sp.]